MRGRTYAVNFENVAVTAAQDLLQIAPADDKPVAVIGWNVDNVSGVGDVGDTAEEYLRASWVTGNTTDGTGGSSPTPRPLDPNDAAAGFSADVNNTTAAANGSPITVVAFAIAVRVPGNIWLPEEAWLHVTQAQTYGCIRLLAAPADSIALSGTFYVLEK